MAVDDGDKNLVARFDFGEGSPGGFNQFLVGRRVIGEELFDVRTNTKKAVGTRFLVGLP